jgi:hypothetical protein
MLTKFPHGFIIFLEEPLNSHLFPAPPDSFMASTSARAAIWSWV